MADYGNSGVLPSWLFNERFGQDYPPMQTAPQGFNGGYLDYRWGPENDGGKAFNQFDISQRYNGMQGIDPRAMGESVLMANDPNMPPSQFSPQQPEGPLPPPPAYPGANQFAGQSPAMGYAPEQPKQQQPLANFPPSGPQSSGWNRFGDALNSNAMTLIGLGAGIAGGQGWSEGLSKGLQGAMFGAKTDREQRMLAAAQGSTLQALIARGVPPVMAQAAMLNPKMLELVQKQYFPEFRFEKTSDTTGGAFNPATGTLGNQVSAPRYDKLGPGDVLQSTVPPTSGAAGTTSPVATGGPEKPPDGYEWVNKNDKSKGLTPIGGGPATKLPEASIAKMALMDAARPFFDKAKAYFLSNEFNANPVNFAGQAIGQATNSFEISRQRRSIKLATEAALRTATGQAAPETEVKRYADFYTPSTLDSLETRRQKLNAMEAFMASATKHMLQGHVPLNQVGAPESFMPNKGGDPLGWK